MFWRVTLPKISWGLLYGVILCNARAMGEFGAVSVVSGHIRGETNTMPLHVEILYNEYNLTAAFAVASLLALLALATLVLKQLVGWRMRRVDARKRGRMSIELADIAKSLRGRDRARRHRSDHRIGRACSRCSALPAPARRRCCA